MRDARESPVASRQSPHVCRSWDPEVITARRSIDRATAFLASWPMIESHHPPYSRSNWSPATAAPTRRTGAVAGARAGGGPVQHRAPREVAAAADQAHTGYRFDRVLVELDRRVGSHHPPAGGGGGGGWGAAGGG